MIIVRKGNKEHRIHFPAAVRTAHATIKDLMYPLMSRAKREDLLFKSKWQTRQFTPQELEAEWTEGRYVWGPSCWHLYTREGNRVY